MKDSSNVLKLCGSLCEGDGISPRHEKRRENKNTSLSDNKRLCRQVQKVTRLVLSELGLDGWDIAAVSQMPGKSVLEVKMVPLELVSGEMANQTLAWLKHHQGKIRAEIAKSIHRKQVPVLHFELGEMV